MEYLSFDLRLSEWRSASRSGMAEVLQSPVGEGERHSFVLDVDLESSTRRTRRTPAMAVELGRRLAEGVLARSWTHWYESYQVARERHRGLRLRLHIDSWELSRLPWELLYDARRRDFVVFDPMVSLVRYLRLHAAPPAVRQGRTLKILAVVASPSDQVQLDAAHELAVLEEALRELRDEGRVEISVCEHATHERLHLALLERQPDAVHYVGHGEYDHIRGTGLLALENETGKTAPLAAPDAARMLRRYGVNLVVLNACESAMGAWAGLAPALVRAEVPAVVAMQWPVEDRAAIRFSRLFYKALSLGRTIDECVAEGRLGASASSADPNDWAAPVLFLRSLSGRLWVSDPAHRREQARQLALPRPTGGAPPCPEGAAPDEGHFRTHGPLVAATDGDLLVERPELRRALRLAQMPSVTQYIAFLSARQTGKTTLLLRLMDLLRDAAACVFVDLSVLRAQDAQACFRFVAFRLLSELRRMWREGTPLPDVRQIQGSVDLLEFLRAMAEATPTPRIVVLLDEVGALSLEVSDAFFNTVRTIFTQGRGLDAHLAKYLFVFSGAVDLYALTSGSNSPLNICEKIYLRDLEVEDVARMVGRLSQLGIKVPKDAAQRVHALTGGHPYLTMRMCALIEQSAPAKVTPQAIDAAAEQMLVEDDNIHHVIHELERRPVERRRLRSIVLEGKEIPFSRNDPVLASLEMIGAVRPTQPCTVRNPLYERALRAYFQAPREAAQRPAPLPEEVEAMYQRLAALRAEAQCEPLERQQGGSAWETYAAALFSVVPAFALYPELRPEAKRLEVILTINPRARGGEYWSAYQPGVLVERIPDDPATLGRALQALVPRARRRNIPLVYALALGGRLTADEAAEASGTCDDVCVVFLADEEVGRVLRQRGDLEALLQARTLDARLRRLQSLGPARD